MASSRLALFTAIIGMSVFFCGESNTAINAAVQPLPTVQTPTEAVQETTDTVSVEYNVPIKSRADKILIGTRIIKNARRRIDQKYAESLASILYDATENNETIDYAFLLAVIESESKFNKDVVSPTGAVGLGQLMPRTAASLAKKSGITYDEAMLVNPEYNVKLSLQYLMKLHKMFHDHILVAAAYNGGPGGARKYKRWIEGEADRNVVHKETLYYVDKVMTRYNSYKMLLQ